MITKENYEIWMIDYLDGTLSDADQKLFLQFLDKNPELKDELDGLDNLILTPTEDKLIDKAFLFKTEADDLKMPYADFVAIKEIETGLSEDEKKWKKEFLISSKEGLTFFETYKNTLLKPLSSIVYPQKGNIKRSLIIPAFTSNGFKKMSAAAATALLLSVGSLPFLNQISNDITTAVNNTPTLIERKEKQTNTFEQNSTQVVKDKKSLVADNILNAEESKQIITEKLNISNTKKTIVKREKINPVKSNLDVEIKINSHINAYETALNHMMPMYIANSIKISNQKLKSGNPKTDKYIKNESEKLSRSAWVLNNGMKIISFITGADSQIDKTKNDDGDLVAYTLESDKITISRKIKNVSVTN